MSEEKEVLVEISDLMINFYTYQGIVKAIDGVDLTILKGETLGLVGETGCGKSVTANAIMKLILSPPGKIEGGRIHFLEPPDVRARRKELEGQAQKRWESLPEAEKKSLTAAYHRFTGFKKRVKPLTKAEIDRTVPSKRAPSGYVVRYMASEAAKLPKSDKAGLEAARNTYDLLSKSDRYMQKIRGRFISMIFQEPTSALNPVFTAGDQIAEVILLHRKGEMAARALERIEAEEKLMRDGRMPKKVRVAEARADHPGERAKPGYKCSVCGAKVSPQDGWCDGCGNEFYDPLTWRLRWFVLPTFKKLLKMVQKHPDSRELFTSRIPGIRRYRKELYREAFREAVRMLRVVRIPDPKGVAYRYPYELSGGMQQRVMIAIALACNPKLLIADEPTTALDVTIQGQILKLMRELKEQYGSSILLITHNLGVVAEMCDRVGVMYAGAMAEIGPARAIFKQPLHPYTVGLMKAVPSVQMDAARLYTIRGQVPNLIHPPGGCRFHPRCDFAKEYCTRVKPELKEIEPGHFVACHKVSGESGYVG